MNTLTEATLRSAILTRYAALVRSGSSDSFRTFQAACKQLQQAFPRPEGTMIVVSWCHMNEDALISIEEDDLTTSFTIDYASTQKTHLDK